MPQKNISIPLHLKFLGSFLRVISNRKLVIILSFVFFISGFLIDCYLQSNKFLAPNSAVVTALGLILTIKHHYLSNIVSVITLISSDYQESQYGGSVEDYAKNEKYVNALLSKATDEGLGLVLILLGTVINAFGVYIPLVLL